MLSSDGPKLWIDFQRDQCFGIHRVLLCLWSFQYRSYIRISFPSFNGRLRRKTLRRWNRGHHEGFCSRQTWWTHQLSRISNNNHRNMMIRTLLQKSFILYAQNYRIFPVLCGEVSHELLISIKRIYHPERICMEWALAPVITLVSRCVLHRIRFTFGHRPIGITFLHVMWNLQSASNQWGEQSML